MGKFPRWSSLTTVFAFAARLCGYCATWGITELPVIGRFQGWLSMGIPLQTQFLSLITQSLSEVAARQVDITAVNPPQLIRVVLGGFESDRYPRKREPVIKLPGHSWRSLYPGREVSWYPRLPARDGLTNVSLGKITASWSIVYCGSGVTACVEFTVFKKWLGLTWQSFIVVVRTGVRISFLLFLMSFWNLLFSESECLNLNWICN